jgi:polysaccharide biosynthesis protein PslG
VAIRPEDRPLSQLRPHPRPAPARSARVLAVVLAVIAVAALLAPAASARTQLRGFALHSLWYDSEEANIERELDLVRRAGGNVVRLDIGWSTLESGGKGIYSKWYLDKLDRFVAAARARGIGVIAGLVSTPCWASSAPEAAKQGCEGSWWERGVAQYPPADPADYGDAARFLTARYGDALAALEVWNEPNSDRFLTSPDKASAYAAILKAAYPAAKAGNPGVPVVAGALAAADRPFLDALYARGIQGHYDAISIHPYNEWRHPSDRWLARWRQYTFLPGIEWIRQAQLAAGDASPLWLTEFGWSTCSGHRWCVSQEQQAEYSARALRLLDGIDYVQAATLYQLRDNGTDASDLESNWGLVTRDYVAKPAFAAVSAALRRSPAANVRRLRDRRARRVKRLTLQVRVSGRGRTYAIGRAPRGRRLVLRVQRCHGRRVVRRSVRSSRRGAYRRRLGRVRSLRGCRVVAHLRGAKSAAARARVPRTRATRGAPHGPERRRAAVR